MFYGAIYYNSAIFLEGVEVTMDSPYYCTVLEEGLLPEVTKKFGDVWTLMHDGLSIHRSDYTKDCLESNDILVSPWLAKLSDLDII